MYVRDKRSPIPKNEAVSRVMSANRSKDTKPELLLRKALCQAGNGKKVEFGLRNTRG
jgi:DNA mismatch endonuclease, patch repair protein